MSSIDKKRARLEDILDQFEVVKAESELTPERQEYVNQLTEEFDSLKAEVDSYEKQQAEIEARLDLRKAKQPAAEPQIQEDPIEEVKNVIPAQVKYNKSKHFASSEDAYVSGMYLAALGGSRKAQDFLNVQSIGVNDEGGFAVPSPLSGALINLLETYGVARQKCRRIIMSADTWAVPKVTAHATVYYPAEAAAITESDVTFGQVTLTAQKVAALIKMSTEVTEDAIVSIMDTCVESIAYQVAKAEDDNLFNGVASAINANGISGDTGVDDTNVASVAALALTDFTACATGIGNPIRGARNEWFMNSTLYHGKIRDLVNAAGGNTIADLEGGQRPLLMGYPVNFVDIMPDNTASTSGDMLAAFGDLSLACYFGDRRSLGFQVLNELYKVNDQIGVIATERVDVKVANPELLAKITIT